VREIEDVLASRRIGILKSVYLNKPTLPPLAFTLTQTDQMLIFLVDEPDEDIHPKLMDFAVYFFGPKTEKFPTRVNAIFFNIDTINIEEDYLQPYIPKDNEFVEKHFEHSKVVKTTVKGFKNLLEVATIDELTGITQLSRIPKMSLNDLVKETSGYWFSKVFQEAKRRLKSLFSPTCPFCSNGNIVHQLPKKIKDVLEIKIELSKENSYIAFCDNKKNGCGWGFISIKNMILGGIHGFFVGREQQYVHELDGVKAKFEQAGLKVHSFHHIKIKSN